MSKRKYKSFIFSLALLLTFINVYPQGHSIPDVEKVTLFTDRSLYITGERVHFTAIVDQEDNIPLLSKILYVEIISPDGKSFIAGKYEINDFKSSGTLSIPDELITGIYYIRAYTKYMRNAGPQSYAVLGIKIVNYTKNEVLPGSDTNVFIEQYSNIEISTRLQITTDGHLYSPGDEVIVTITGDSAMTKSGSLSNISLSIVPTEASKRKELKASPQKRDIERIQYIPELFGNSISGIALKDNKPIQGVVVTLSTIEHFIDFQSQITDSAGRFLFKLPHLYGIADLYIGSGDDTSNQQIKVDNEYCVLPVNLPHPKFTLSDTEKDIAIKLAMNHQVNLLFRNDSVENNKITAQNPSTSVPFYGTAQYKLTLEDYVQLPTLEEYFNELPGFVKVRKQAGKKYFKIIGDQPEMDIYAPLIMVDQVYINDPEKILSASPANIKSIEMFTKPYLKGDRLFGGIISIISKKGDLAGIELPPSGYFISLNFLNPPYTNEFELTSNLPDSRNTIYFEPEVNLSESNKAIIRFLAPTTPANYSIVLSGLTNYGTVFTLSANFDVKITEIGKLK